MGCLAHSSNKGRLPGKEMVQMNTVAPLKTLNEGAK
jgi:hypothetical protein